ncbi:SDR family oxidoreductase [Mesobacillus foraminis]|uniref:SDR family oxidoreductase n=1 Tax=Mesobacillus foraminis TaxID=279826 RepID=UPI001BE61DDE|nr:SDR family oxidoreductase [Mesobacillus foraminis]MBT2759148.1 SDR family oxidoreductase [Mesobacillus foraminis]
MKTILITGSSSGIGKAAAFYFAQRNWNVVATMRSPGKERDLTGLGNVLVTRLDVEDKDSIQESVDQGINRFGKIDAVLNNAALGARGIFEAADDERIRSVFEVNVFGVMNVAKAILPHFRRNNGGTMINMSSMGGRITLPNLSLYHASKFAIEGFTEALYYELNSQNIKVKLIEPGAVDSDFGRRPSEYHYDETLADYKEYTDRVNQASLKMLGTSQMIPPEKVAEVVFQAASDQSSQLRYIVGEDAKALIHLRETGGDRALITQISQMLC